jgi:two-component system CheB/CheR fusion protein
VFGYAAEEIMGQPLDVLFTPEDRAAGAPESERATALREGRAEDERWHLRKDGTRFYCSGIMTPLQGDIKGFAKIARDLTGNKEQEAQREAQLQREKVSSSQARAANELKDRFLAVMSHELKHPLNLIQVSAELLVNQPEVKALPSVMRAGETISLAVASQAKIIDDLLDLSRARTGKLTLKLSPVDLGDLLGAIVEAALPHAASKGVELSLEKEAAMVVFCDRVRTEQICWNLLNNAIKFTPRGGSVQVRLQREAGFARLSVVDTGQGIAADFLPHVFGMFAQGDEAQLQTGGLGVGLALVQELANAQGGRVLAESEGEGRGAAFSVWLPLHAESTGSAREDGPPAAARSLRGMRILAVDDMLDALEPFAALLRIDGAQVDIADSGEKALQMLEASPYDVLISDLGMAGMDGFALIAEVRRTPGLRAMSAIALSGYGRASDVARALQLGFDAHLSKPASLAGIRNAIAGLKSRQTQAPGAAKARR